MLLTNRKGLIVDLFAGGGGASTGIEMALGRSPDIAINHDPEALAMHRANHPDTLHFCQNVLQVYPLHATGGRPVDLLWASPDCTHFSKAKGGKPRDQFIRDLAWVVIRWATDTKPKIICVENVEEFQTWGPLDEEGQPIKSEAGKTFKEWVAALRKLGYKVSWQELKACDFGAPTTRKRLFIVARLQGKVKWPKPTHGPDTGQPWRTAAECIDWSDQAPSIFERKKPLAENTQRRIAEGIRRYVLTTQKPFLVTYYGPKRPGDFRGAGLDEPLKTQSTENRFGLVSPLLVSANHTAAYYKFFRGQSADSPLGTITQAPGFAVCSPYLVPNHSGENFRGQGIAEPVGTMTGKGSFCLTTPHLISIDHKGKSGEFRAACRECAEPLNTITQENRHALIGATLVKMRGTNIGSRADTPLQTISAQGQHHAICAASLCKYYSEGGQHADIADPLHTITSKARFAIQSAHLQQYNGASEAQPLDDPMPTVPTKDRFGLTAATLCQYNGRSECQPLDDPMPTLLGENKMGLVTCNSDAGHYIEVRAFLRKWGVIGEDEEAEVLIDGVRMRINDIGLRMLRPRELFKAQGFPDSYEITPKYNGKPLTITSQVKKCGNSVPPQFAEAVILENIDALEYSHPVKTLPLCDMAREVAI